MTLNRGVGAETVFPHKKSGAVLEFILDKGEKHGRIRLRLVGHVAVGSDKGSDSWDAAFDWDNDRCDEVIFGFPASKGYTHWHYDGDTYAWTVPAKAAVFFNDTKSGVGHNTKYAASPSYDLNGELYDYELGMPVQNFRKYPGDVRMKFYRNLGNSRREGMFLFGYLEYVDPETGATKLLRAPEAPYDLYLRDGYDSPADNCVYELSSTVSPLQ